ncbi:MAG: hypothetical protein V2I97_05430 [Desulfococcaceae bacterium]|jgi:proteic killer suppression protein|nr:hypothetical protein [Desulfococcaceae bacterium]
MKETEKIFNRRFSKKLPHDIQRKALEKLWMVDVADELSALRIPPGNRLEALEHDRKGEYPDKRSMAYMLQMESQ